ncbi:MAG TPA: TonB-dependent receptor plug domain-containing protein, partial [Povalibacter sp.]
MYGKNSKAVRSQHTLAAVINRVLRGGWSFTRFSIAASASVLAVSAQAAETKSQEVEEVIVTGMRQSIESAQDIKRNAEQIVDSVAAVDITALPDRTVTETLQRIPGVAIDHLFAPNDTNRFSAEGSGVVVRGMTQVR